MAGIPRIREAGWFITDSDRDPVRHLFVRLEQYMDGSGAWTLELHECRGRRGVAGKAEHRYATETDARTALVGICALSNHLAPLPTWTDSKAEPGRWRMLTYAD
jgi:hypothetical protein